MKTILAIVLLCCSLSAQWSSNVYSLRGGCPEENGLGVVAVYRVGNETETTWIDYDVHLPRVLMIGVAPGFTTSPLFPSLKCVIRIDMATMVTIPIPVGRLSTPLLRLPLFTRFGPLFLQDMTLEPIPRLSDGWIVNIYPS